MKIETFGKRICQLRKSANMTQRDLANKLGISEPAVCKWETDSSMPDVMLLTPLARALHTDLNTLFSYEERLSLEKVKVFADQAEEIGRTEGQDAGIRYWNACLQEYPNSELLMLAYAKWLMRQQTENDTAEELLLILRESEEAAIQCEAKRYLASFYITSQRFEEAENVLAVLPDFDFNARHLQALLLYVKKDYEACRKDAEQFLFECVQNALICLSRLAGVAVATQDKEKERIYAEMMCRMEKELGIPFYRGDTQMIDYYLHNGEEEKAAECFEAYAESMIHAEECLKESPFLGDLGEEIRFISNGTLVSLEAFREELFQVMQSPGYMKPICESSKYRESMEKLGLYMKEK